MSEKLPYEEQLDRSWDTLLLPDEDLAWKDMKRRLDEDDDDKIVVPPPGRGCGIGVLLLGLLSLVGIWLLVRPEKWFNKKQTDTAQQTKEEDKKTDSVDKKPIYEQVTAKDGSNEENDKKNVITESTDKRPKATKASDSKNTSLQEPKQDKETGVEINTARAGTTKKGSKNETISLQKDRVIPMRKVQTTNNYKKDEGITSRTDQPRQKNMDVVESKPDSTGIVVNPMSQPDPLNDRKKDETQVAQKPDPVTKTASDSTARKNNKTETKTSSSPKKEKAPRPIFFSAGTGLHQQIPIAGQEWATYGSLGRKGILSDYIPSVNFRVEKQYRWFVQSEFRYGAPQFTKQVTYSEKISIDTSTQSIITNSSSLKKTFYHQVPITFNNYVLKGWSVGVGLQWNKFHSAVAEQGLAKRSPGSTNDSVISKNIVKVSNDSSTALVKSWWQGIVQTQYQWKRFSIGARYSFGLQPYIRFTLPNQSPQEEKNSSFQVFLRYELWRSKK